MADGILLMQVVLIDAYWTEPERDRPRAGGNAGMEVQIREYMSGNSIAVRPIRPDPLADSRT